MPTEQRIVGVVYPLHAGRSLEGDCFDRPLPEVVVYERKQRFVPSWAYRPLIASDLRAGEAASDPLPRITDAEVDALWEHEPDVWESVPAAKKRKRPGGPRSRGRRSKRGRG